MFAPVILPDSMLMASAPWCAFIAPLRSLRSQSTSLFSIHPQHHDGMTDRLLATPPALLPGVAQAAAVSAMNHWGLSAAAIGSDTVLFGTPSFGMHESTRRTPSRLKNRTSN